MTLELHSPAFGHEEQILDKYTCDGANVSPPLTWSGVPDDTISLVLIVDDPDAPDPKAPTHTHVHWLLYDITPTTPGLKDDQATPPTGAREGLNGWKKRGYGGPCPPVGKHRYVFKLYALDAMLGDLGAPRKERLEQAMRDHVIAQAELIGTYERVTAGRT
jgi:Raf kinase inhibitor-like YbhB/YbcL family protein